MNQNLRDLYITYAQHAAQEIANYLDRVQLEGAELDLDYLRALHNIERDQITSISVYNEYHQQEQGRGS
jgi:hypothetical protein